MNPTPSHFTEVRERAHKRLIEALHSGDIPEWVTGEKELQDIARRVVAVKEWLMIARKNLKDEKTAFTAEEIMEQLGYDDWRTLGVVNAALHELAATGGVAVLDPGAPAIFSFRDDAEPA
jgi:hypothetical protein